jgi:sodium-dependent dicarboxylate transporter 2/3/5
MKASETEYPIIAATSLLPLVLLPMMGIMKSEAASAPYADLNVFLFLEGKAGAHA